jgi:hypothetical protein
VGSQSSIPLAFNDSVWAKYELGAYTGLTDASGKVYTRNVFNQPTPKDLHLLMQAVDSPMIPALAGAMPALAAGASRLLRKYIQRLPAETD